MFRGSCLSCIVVMPVGPGAFCLNVLSVFLYSSCVIGGKCKLCNRVKSLV